MNIHRIKAVMIRHLFTWPRDIEALAETFWWPSFDLLIWGLTTRFLQGQGASSQYLGFFLGAIVLWMFVYRSQQEVGLVFLREVWDRNILNMLTSPLTIWEFLTASLLLGFMKLLCSAIWMAVLAYVLFAFNIFSFGWYLIPFILNLLIVGWAAGFAINGLIIRYGFRIQAFAWTLILIIQPFSAVFYPLSVLPEWMQWVARLLPTSYIFEGMRTVLSGGVLDISLLGMATALNVMYLTAALFFFQYCYGKARESGMIVKFS